MLNEFAIYLHEFWPAIVAVVGVCLGLRWFVRASKQQADRQAQYRDRLRNL
jgi:hypothetical protein